MLKNKTAAVTGGTRGIGLAIVKKYLENGGNSGVLYSSSESSRPLAKKDLRNLIWVIAITIHTITTAKPEIETKTK